ncbi:MAG TPA: pitrilysin family protein [Candidatus Saccharicenans sp.]|nr:pitrilysin family protein [Candidatus Saccharicenans sp.]HPU93627.1 pitrilysin family protein [Candidatus Saccharicenans sp.]
MIVLKERQKKYFFAARLFLFILLLGLGAERLEAQLPSFPYPLSYFKLKNGLEVIVCEDSSLPLVSVVVTYSVGSVNDPENKGGLALMMQYLMFQGSQNVGPMQHLMYIQNAGGELNASTTFDKTFFYETVPSNQLSLVLWLESDRMNSLEVNEAKVARIKELMLANEQERNLQEPYARYFFLMDQILFPDFSYGHSPLGTKESINSITVEDVLSFYRRYYVPSNALICISGDIKAPKARELVSKYFETIPGGAGVPSYPEVDFSSVISSRDQIIIDPLVSTPALQFGLRLDKPQPEEKPVLRLFEYLLINGKSSRLYRLLVSRERIALYLNGGLEDRRGFISLKIFLLANNQIMIDRSKKLISDELNKFKLEMVSERELVKAKNKYRYDFWSQLTTTNLARALTLTEFYLDRGQLPDLDNELAAVNKVTAYSILALARKYLQESKYCFVTILPR